MPGLIEIMYSEVSNRWRMWNSRVVGKNLKKTNSRRAEGRGWHGMGVGKN